MKCENCGSAITCGCQKRVLANGKQGCTKCINKLAKEKDNKTKLEEH
jgi:hypothetical protein